MLLLKGMKVFFILLCISQPLFSIAQSMQKSKFPSKNYHMGTCTHFDQGWDRKKILPLVDSLGVGWIRDEIYWNKIEKEKGIYNIPEFTMDWIRAIHTHHLKLLLIINGSNSIYSNPYDAEAYANFAAAMASRLKEYADAFEILNEPANFGFTAYYGGAWNGMEAGQSVSPWVSKYVELFNKAADTIKKVNPAVKVIGLGSAAPVNFRQIALGLSKNIDGITDHPYSFKVLPERTPYTNSTELMQRDGIVTSDAQGNITAQVALYREQLQKFNGPGEIWFSEFGYGAFTPNSKFPFEGLSRQVQAKYLLRRFVECLALNIEVNVQYDFRDDGKDTLVNDNNFGLLDFELHPKPSFFAVQRLAKATAGFTAETGRIFKINGTVPGAGDNVRIYGFKDEQDHAIIAAWKVIAGKENNQSFKTNIFIETTVVPAKIKLLDMMTGASSYISFKKINEGIELVNFTLKDYPQFLYVQ